MRRWLLRGGLGLVLLGGLGAVYVDRTIHTGFGDGRPRGPVRYYAAPRRIGIGVRLDASGLSQELAALDYRETDGPPSEPGTYRRLEDGLEIFLREAPYAGAYGARPPRRVRLLVEEARVRDILDEEEGAVASFDLEPRPLEGVYEGHWTSRRRTRLEDVPPKVVDAVLAAEDARFLDHMGIDFGSLARAFEANWRAGEVRQGGSTITQQLIKNHFLTQERTLWRKMREIPLALALERRYTKREILAAYLASVYLGHDRLVGVHGLAEGAWVYFGKDVSDLTLGEGAMLAGIIRAPNANSPLRHPERARVRRDRVLEHLQELGWATAAEVAAARAEPIGRPQTRGAASESYFVQNVASELAAIGWPSGGLPTGTDVFTTLDARLQEIVTEEVQQAAGVLAGAQVAVVALDPLSGEIRALAGGRDYLESQFDRASRMRRPVGSMFKPFVALAALADPEAGITPATRLQDAPLTVGEGAAAWMPRNHDGRFRGTVTLREALVDSLNVPMVRLAERVGFERLAAFGDRLKIRSDPLPRLPSIALGSFESSLLDVTAAYTLFPGGGVRVEPFSVRAVKAPSGIVLHHREPAEVELTPTAPSYVVHSMLEDVVDEGTAQGLREAGVKAAFAGKTGTTSEQRDAWFVGYTPSLVLGVWVGFDDDRPLPGGAAQLAVPLWGSIARRAFAGGSLEPFRRPAGVEEIEIDAASGLRAAPGCEQAVSEVFVAGTAPARSCDEWKTGATKVSS